MPDHCRRVGLALAVLAATLVVPTAATGAQVDAVPGQPFGVAELTIDYPPADVTGLPDSMAFSVTSPDQRVAYPAFDGFRRRLRFWPELRPVA